MDKAKKEGTLASSNAFLWPSAQPNAKLDPSAAQPDTETQKTSKCYHRVPVDTDPSVSWRVETLSSYGALLARRTEWQTLETVAADAHSAFQGTAWCFAWMAHLGQLPSITFKVSFIYRNGELVAVLPLMRQRQFGLNQLLPLGYPHTQLCDGLTRQGTDCSQGLALALSEVTLDPSLDVVSIGAIAEGSALHAALMMLRGVCKAPLGTIQRDPAEHLTLVDGSGLSKNLRKTVRKGTARLKQKGGLTFERIPSTEPTFSSTALAILDLKKAWLKRRKTYSSGLSADNIEAFIAGLAVQQSGFHKDAFTPELELYRSADRIVAAHINLVGHGFRQVYLSTFDPAFADASPGNCLIHQSLETRDADVQTAISLLGFPTPQKASWASGSIPLLRYDHGLTVKGRLWLSLWQHRAKPLLKSAYLSAVRLIRSVKG